MGGFERRRVEARLYRKHAIYCGVNQRIFLQLVTKLCVACNCTNLSYNRNMVVALQGKSDILLSTAEAAVMLGLSETTIRTYVARGKLFPLRVGQTLVFPKEECERYMAEKLPTGKPKKNI